MKSWVFTAVTVAISLAGMPGPRAVAADIASEHSIEGIWKGSLEFAGQELPLTFTIEVTPSGRATGNLLSPENTNGKVPLSQISLRDREVKIYVDLFKASFVGKLSPKSGRIKGDWSQGGYEVPLELVFIGDELIVDRPQNPSTNPPYEVSNVRFLNKFGPHRIAGTLTLPTGVTGKVPGVVLLSGNGSHDRDHTQFGHKPFWVLADYLTRKGIAVLRFDDRGTGESEGNFEEGSHRDFATDSWTAAEYLSTRPEIDKSKIGLIGYGGDGGVGAPIVATKRNDITFLVLLAAPAVSGEKTILSQTDELGRAVGLPESFLDLTYKFSEALFEALKAPVPDFQRIQTLGARFEEEAKNVSGIDPARLEGLQETMLRDLSMFEKPWLHNYVKHDPGPVLESLKCPVLALYGEKDLQIIATVHAPEAESHLKAAGNPKSQVEVLRGLNHLFQRVDLGIPAEYHTTAETVSPSVLKRIADWVSAQ